MSSQSKNLLPPTLALVRIGTGLMFILFGQYKIFGAGFVPVGFANSIARFINENQAVSFYQVFLANVVLPHPKFFALLVGWGELLIGIALLAGVWVRVASVGGALFMLNLTLATWHAPGPTAPLWRYAAAQLEHIPLLFLFVIFIAARTQEIWTLKAAWRRWRASRPQC